MADGDISNVLLYLAVMGHSKIRNLDYFLRASYDAI